MTASQLHEEGVAGNKQADGAQRCIPIGSPERIHSFIHLEDGETRIWSPAFLQSSRWMESHFPASILTSHAPSDGVCTIYMLWMYVVGCTVLREESMYAQMCIMLLHTCVPRIIFTHTSCGISPRFPSPQNHTAAFKGSVTSREDARGGTSHLPTRTDP